MWLRGILSDDYGIEPDMLHWTTFEGAHVAEYADPPWAGRAAADANLLDLMRNGALAAVIVGNDVPDDTQFRTLFPDPADAAQRFQATHGFMPVNHLIAVRRELADEEPALVADLVRLFEQSRDAAAAGGPAAPPIGHTAVAPSWRLAARYCRTQGLLPREVREDELWGAHLAV
jgi:4,5-dihydroxyphthalate decarboxylase